MFDWLHRKVQITAYRQAKEDLERFVDGIRGMDSYERSMLLATAVIIRTNLDQYHEIPGDIFKDDYDGPVGEYQIRLNRLIKQFQKTNRPSDAAATMVWLHSLRAVSSQELVYLAKEMWGLLLVSESSLAESFDQIQESTGKELNPLVYLWGNLVPDRFRQDNG